MKTLIAIGLLLASSSFAAIQYAGGTNVNAQCTASAGTKQELSDCIQDNLTTAGWTVISGSHTTSVLMESASTPASLQMRLSLTQGTNCVILKGRNVGNTKAATTGQFLLPAVAKVFRVVANKYQYFVYTDGATTARSFAAGGVLYVPSFTGLTEAIWTVGNAVSDTDTGVNSSFKFCLNLVTSCNGAGTNSNSWVTLNGTQLEFVSANNQGYVGIPHFVLPFASYNTGTTLGPYKWFDGSAFITEPLMAFSPIGSQTLSTINGSTWDTAIITDSIAAETVLTFDTHSWIAITNSNTGSAGIWARGTLVHVVP